MKTCSKCKTEKDRSAFHRNRSTKDGLCSWCKSCVRKYQQSEAGKEAKQKSEQKYRPSDKGKAATQRHGRKRRLLYPEKIKASSAVCHAVRDGKLTRPSHCESCFEERFVEGHHWSYLEEHWLDVEWLCAECHVKRQHEIEIGVLVY